MRGVDSFDAIIISPPISESLAVKELQAIEQNFDWSNTIKSTSAATKNQAYVAELLRDLRVKNIDAQKDTPDSKSNESPKKDTSGSGSNTGTGASSPEPASGSTQDTWSNSRPSTQGEWSIATGSKTENSREISSRISDLKQLQQNKGDYTRPDGTIGVPPEKSLMEQFFANDPLFGDNWDPSDY
jgi:hypothetical protein